MAEMTAADRRAVEQIRFLMTLSHDRTFTCTELGERLFSGYRKRQCYARPAGKVIKRLVGLGLVRPAERGSGRWRRSCYVYTGADAP